MDLRDRKSINKAVLMWAVVALLLLIMATPALSTIFAAPGSVNTKALVKGAVKTKKIANRAVTGAKIANGAVTAAKINRTGLNADLLDGRDGADYVAKTGDQAMAGNLTAGNVSYGSAKTGYFTIAGTALQPSNSDVVFYKSVNNVFPGGSDWAWFTAPVNLPQGATVIGVLAKVYDGEPTATFDVEVSLNRYTSTAFNIAMSSASTSGASGVWQSIDDNSIVDPVIDNSVYNYAVWAKTRGEAGANHRISLVTVVYTYTGAGD